MAEEAAVAEDATLENQLEQLEQQIKTIRDTLGKQKPNNNDLLEKIQHRKPISSLLEQSMQILKQGGEIVRDCFAFVDDLPFIFRWLIDEITTNKNYQKIGLFIIELASCFTICLSVLFTIHQGVRIIARRHRGLAELIIKGISYSGTYLFLPYLTYLMFKMLENREHLQEIAFELAQGTTAIFVLSRLSRLILEPYRPQERYWNIKDQYSLMIHTFIQYFNIIGIGGYAVTRSLLELGMPDDLNLRLLHFIAFILCGALIIWVIQYKNVYNYLEKNELPKNFRIAPYLRALIFNSWHLPLIALFVTIYIDFCGVVPQAQIFIRALFLTILMIIAVAFLETKMIFFRTHVLQKTSQFHPPFLTKFLIDAPHKIDHFAIIFLYALAVLTLFEVWNISLISWFTSGTAQIVLQKITAISLIFLGVFTILRGGHYIFEKYTIDLHQADDHASARIKTVIAILRNSLRIGVWVPAIFLIVSELGFDITPLVASFGVFSFAIGFGSQNLVKDIITGLFIILEDTISVGDLVKLDGLNGLVEALTIRTIALREEDGTLHTIPFSSISRVSNSTRHFSCAVITVKISYKEDIQRIFDCCRQVYNTMKTELPWSRLILGPLEIKGVEDFQETGIVIKVIIRTVVSKNTDVRREFNLRIKSFFDKEGVLLGNADRTFDVVLHPTPPMLIP